jgi:hypothetical protein
MAEQSHGWKRRLRTKEERKPNTRYPQYQAERFDDDSTIWAADLGENELKQILIRHKVPVASYKHLRTKPELVAKVESVIGSADRRVLKALNSKTSGKPTPTHRFSRLSVDLLVYLSHFLGLSSHAAWSSSDTFLRARLTLATSGTPSRGLTALTQCHMSTVILSTTLHELFNRARKLTSATLLVERTAEPLQPIYPASMTSLSLDISAKTIAHVMEPLGQLAKCCPNLQKLILYLDTAIQRPGSYTHFEDYVLQPLVHLTLGGSKESRFHNHANQLIPAILRCTPNLTALNLINVQVDDVVSLMHECAAILPSLRFLALRNVFKAGPSVPMFVDFGAFKTLEYLAFDDCLAGQ